jgi:hypothetical protein
MAGRRLSPARTGGLIDSQSQVGGWGDFRPANAPPDADRDGMPDAWEKQHGLNPADRSDAAADRDRDGYSNLEEFLNRTDRTAPGE